MVTERSLRGLLARRLAGLIAVVGLAVAAFAIGPAEPAFAQTWVGEVDMEDACRSQWGRNWSAFLNGSTAYDWFCWDGVSNFLGRVDVESYCSWKYFGAHADPQGGGAYDWGCYLW